MRAFAGDDVLIKSVLYDLDGTLLDRDNSLLKFVEDQYERRFSRLDIDKSLFISRFIELDNRGYVWKDKVYSTLIHEFDLSSVTVTELLDDYLSNFKFHCVPFPNLVETLQFLKTSGLRLGIISNGFGTFQMDNIKALHIEQYFDEITISEWEGVKKPDPEIFIRTLRKLGVRAQEAIYVGDHPDNDVRSSKNVGMKSIWKRDHYFQDTFEADGIIDDLLEIKDFLEG